MRTMAILWLSVQLSVFSQFTLAHTNQAADQEPIQGTSVSAAASVTWRDNGVVESGSAWQIPGALMGGEALPVTENTTVDDVWIKLHHYSASGVYGLIEISSHEGTDSASLHHAMVGLRKPWQDVILRWEAGRSSALFSPSNTEHASERLFSETPLVYDVFFGRQYNDEGMRLRTSYGGFELGIESWRGAAFPATSGENGGAKDIYLQYTYNKNAWQWTMGSWWFQADAQQRTDQRYNSEHNHGSTVSITVPSTEFSGTTETYGFFWRNQWQLSERSAVNFDAEWLWSQVSGDLRDATRQAQLDSDWQGGWVQVAFNYEGHALALRQEKLILDNQLRGAAANQLALDSGLINDGHEPSRTTLLYGFKITPNLRLRLEWTQDESSIEDIQRAAIGLVWQQALWPAS